MAAPVFQTAGTVSATNGTNPTPGLPSGLSAGDLMLMIVHTRDVTDGSIGTPSGWTKANIGTERGTGGCLAVFTRAWQSGDAAPTVTLTNHATGNSGESAIARIFRISGAGGIGTIGTRGNFAAALNIGAISGITAEADSLVVVVGGKLDDWTSVATLSGDGLTWTEMADNPNTQGADNGLVVDSAPCTSSTSITNKTFTVTGGTSVASCGVMFTIKAPLLQDITGDSVSLSDSITPVKLPLQSAGPFFPSATSQTGGATSWSNISRITASDDSSASITVSAGGVANTLLGTSFGFSLPSDATIWGIVLEIDDWQNDATGPQDFCYLTKDGSTEATPSESVTNQSGWQQIGTSSYKWGATWTYSEINSTNFGVILGTDNSTIATWNTSVDAVRITVYYTSSSGGTSHQQPVDDTLSLADARTFDRELVIPDNPSVADALKFDREMLLTDNPALADALSREFGVNPADTLGLADNNTRETGKGVTVDDSVSPADALVFQREILFADSVSLADARTFDRLLVLGDTVGLADAAATVQEHFKNFDDSVALSDALRFDRELRLTDSVTPADALVFERAMVIADTLGIADSIFFDRAIVIPDSVSLSDLADPVLTTGGGNNLTQDVNDTLSIADALSFAIEMSLGESVNLNDALSFERAMVLADSLALADSLTFDRTIVLLDTLSLADQIALERALAVSVDDSLSLTDLIAMGRELLIAEGVTLSDARTFLVNGQPWPPTATARQAIVIVGRF